MLLTGGDRPTDAELADGAALLKEEIPDYETPPTSVVRNAQLPKAVPDFWLTVLKNFPETAYMVSERDEGVLASLTDIRASYLAPPGSPDPSFRVSFFFAPNAFFRDAVLWKDFVFRRGPNPGDEKVFDGSSASAIEWNEGMDLTQSEDEGMSFFSGFFSAALRRPTDAEKAQLDEGDLEMLEGVLSQDIALGEAFKDDVSRASSTTVLYSQDLPDNSKRPRLVHVSHQR